MDINGAGAIVTGGASGLGGATAARLAKAGAMIVIFDLNADLGGGACPGDWRALRQVDVTDEAAVEAALQAAERLNGKPGYSSTVPALVRPQR